MPQHILLIDTLVFLFAVYFSYRLYRRPRGNFDDLPLPPGPKGLPLIGNILDVPSVYQWKPYHQLCKDLGTGILYLNMSGTSIVVLDTHDAAQELLEKRSLQYSGRPRMTMANELMGWDFDFAFMDDNDVWKQHRKLMQQSFTPNDAKDFRTEEVRSARRFLLNVIDNEDVISNLRRLSGETIMSIAYGLDIEPTNDPYLTTAEQGVRPLLRASSPGAFLVDSFPFLKYVPSWVPGANFKRHARVWKIQSQAMLNKPFEALMSKMESTDVRPSFVADGLQKVNSMGEHGLYTLENLKSVGATLFQAGSDTTVAATGFCILSLLSNPDVVRRAQEEIDAITEYTRLPDFGDEESLPFITAIVKEALRYWAITPLAVPHFLHVDDEFKGYRIPAGSVILPNTWAILHDETVYPDAFTFKPERFLKSNNDMEHNLNAIWGFGQRICPGRFMAFSQIWIIVASMLAVYDLDLPIGDDGRPVEPSHEFDSSLLLQPRPFRCVFRPRPKAKSLLEGLKLAGPNI